MAKNATSPPAKGSKVSKDSKGRLPYRTRVALGLCACAALALWYAARPAAERVPLAEAPKAQAAPMQNVPGQADSARAAPSAVEGEAPRAATQEAQPASPESTNPLAAFAPLLDGKKLAAFKDLHIAALAAGEKPGGGIAVLNGRLLREGEMLGLSRLVYVGPDVLVMQFKNRHYALYPKREPKNEPKPEAKPEARRESKRGKR